MANNQQDWGRPAEISIIQAVETLFCHLCCRSKLFREQQRLVCLWDFQDRG